jgi:hypothetical protein
VVEARIDQLERQHLHTEHERRLHVSARVGAVAGAGEDPVPHDHEVALALVDVRRLDDVLEARATEPGEVGRRLGRALRVREARAEARPPTTSPPFAAKTMSGSPGTGSSSSTVCPSRSYVARSASHWTTARSRSTGRVGSIQGLMA